MFTTWRLLLGMVITASVFGTLPQCAVAGLIVTEVEPNTTFSIRQQLPGGTTEVRGTLAPGDPLIPAFSFNSVLASGMVDFYSIPGQSPNTPFFAWTDNSNSGTDTYLGTFATNADASTLIASDDDGGEGLVSALGGICES